MESGITQKIVGVEQPKRYVGITLESAADGGGDGLAGFTAQSGLFAQFDDDALHAPHDSVARCHMHPYAQLLVQPRLKVTQILEIAQLLQTCKQTKLFVAGEQQNALRLRRRGR